MGNPNDIIRDAILRYLYGVHSKARSPKSTGQGIRDLTTGMKKAGFNYKQQEISSNLDYLIQKEWVREVVENRSFTTPRGTTQNAEKRSYKISDLGIDRLEAASAYKDTPSGARINITNVNGVTIIGDGNVVNASFTDLSRTLDELKDAVLGLSSLSNEQKLVTVSDIDTIQAQLQKPDPDKAIVQKVWAGVEKVVTAGGLVELANKAVALLGPLFS